MKCVLGELKQVAEKGGSKKHNILLICWILVKCVSITLFKRFNWLDIFMSHLYWSGPYCSHSLLHRVHFFKGESVRVVFFSSRVLLFPFISLAFCCFLLVLSPKNSPKVCFMTIFRLYLELSMSGPVYNMFPHSNANKKKWKHWTDDESYKTEAHSINLKPM